MKKTLATLFIAILLTGCTGSDDTTLRVLKNEGCTDIQLTGYDFFGCSDSDNFSSGFTATRNGQKVKGVVCRGILKGATVRYY